MVDTKLNVHGIDTSNVKLVFPQKKDGKDIIPKHINASTVLWAHHTLLGIIRDYYNNENSSLNPQELPNLMITRSLILHSLISYYASVGLYETRRNILVIPNWKENEHTALYDKENTTKNYDPTNESHDYAVHPILSMCFWPIWKCILNGYHSITVALPPEYSLLKKVFNEYDSIDIANCSKPYELGDNTYNGFTITNLPQRLDKYDVVQLIGHDRPEIGTTFKAEDIKADFKRYCKEDFLLHDLWRPKGSFRQIGINNVGQSYRGIEGTQNERALKSIEEMRSWIQSNQYGMQINNNNDSDVSALLKGGWVNWLGKNRMLYSDSDISKATWVNPTERIKQNGLGQTIKENSSILFQKAKNQYIPIF
tara:strand:- start:58 stop:1158 length:1101 start_codon:yes stop_codon:yes gene_type:complete